MPVLDLAHLLVAFQIAYVKILCIFTSIFLGPWTGIQIYLYSKHPEDDAESRKKLLLLISTILCCSVYLVTVFLLAAPDKQRVLLLWLISCVIAIAGHWTLYSISFHFWRSSLDEMWLPLAISTIVFMAVYALPLFYIYFINYLNDKRIGCPEESRRTRGASSDHLSYRSEGFAEVMQLPNSMKCKIPNDSSSASKYENRLNVNKNICETEIKIQNTSVNTVLIPNA